MRKIISDQIDSEAQEAQEIQTISLEEQPNDIIV